MTFPARQVAVAIFLFTLSVTGSALAAAQTDSPAPRIAANNAGETVELLPLDDPDNPYAGQYAAWDVWMWDNYTSDFKRDEYDTEYSPEGFIYSRKDGVPLPEYWQCKLGAADENGFLIPELVFYNSTAPDTKPVTVMELLVPADKPDIESPFIVYATGAYPPELRQAHQAAFALEDAKLHPLIPAWLGNNLPQQVVFMPNGDILCYGELGLHYSTEQENPVTMYVPGPVKPDPWYRYSAAGELLGTMTIGKTKWPVHEPWRDLYRDGFNEYVNDYLKNIKESEGLTYHRLNNKGYIAVFTSPHPRPASAWDVDYSSLDLRVIWDIYGNEADADSTVEPVNNMVGRAFTRSKLAPVYAAQVELGLVDPEEESPFTGMQNGPVVVDDTPRVPTYLAQYYKDTVTKIEVKPMDDPANPYLESYEPWDTWLLENVGQHNPRQEAYANEMFRKQMEERAKLEADGKEVPDELFSYPIYDKPEDDPWKYYEVYVDGNGWVVPARVYMEANNSRLYGLRDLRYQRLSERDFEYHLSAGGVMPTDMQEAYDLAQWEAQAPYLPEIPDWLAQAPVYTAVFIPNGDIVTLGPLGCRPENANELSKEEKWRNHERGWYRYDAAGNLVDSLAMTSNEWPLLYNEHFRDMMNNADQQGLKASTPYGYIVIRNPDTDEVKAVFDYDGTPVNPNESLYRELNYCTLLQWNRIKWIHGNQNRDDG